ncbi:ADP-glucose pyrophosphorylase [Thecamonas trahens ATCC 50062]|uniref:ADP-glucose pyrophosphorylase n=1 Tax=Thecamonas trahens ATCC 50062 TaxID=461836 RepID=A0A0L0D826_THETB|nr:ADP-glucose pyrophosphorylase [Thecamonas trahens ATCC 50062]KNC47463.1 ADP-glucose pyrophosphorylase [Thecamonas trahens ATCC 50062]|eukprot:XP_013759399.1 ADP-glucose pyrophosphorylase [Thecamonas trahens ATCC 50062]
MAETTTSTTVVILCGGRGTRFRPLSFRVPKPLFPIANAPVIDHSLRSLPTSGVKAVFLVGFYGGSEYETQFAHYADDLQSRLNVPVKYLREPVEAGTAAGLAHFAQDILAPNSDAILVANSDVAGALPLVDMLKAHADAQAGGVELTLLATTVPEADATKYGCMVVDGVEVGAGGVGKVAHYAEKPEVFVSNTVSCGVYVFSRAGFQNITDAVASAAAGGDGEGGSSGGRSAAAKAARLAAAARQPVGLEVDVIVPMVAKDAVQALVTHAHWAPVKTPSAALDANAYYLGSEALAGKLLVDADVPFTVVGNVCAADLASATIHADAVIGPNVALAAGVTIGAGARVRDAIVLEGAVVADSAFVKHAIVGWNAIVGEWARVEGDPAHAADADMSATILGDGVEIKPETVVRNCVVLPHKVLKADMFDRVIL